jgi:hypothetical protein
LLDSIRAALEQQRTPPLAPVEAWLTELETRNRPFTVLEHSILTFFLAQAIFPHPAGEATPELAEIRRTHDLLNTRIRALLGKSWVSLTGRARNDDKLLTRLPLSVLRNASRHDRVWHGASFIPSDTSPSRQTQRAATSWWRDFVPTNAAIAAVLGALVAGAVSTAAADVLAGLLVMHAAISFQEFGAHRIMHPWTKLRSWIRNGPAENASALEKRAHASTFKSGPNSIADTIAEHDVHHFWTYRRFTEMFSTMPQEKVDALIDKRYAPQHAAKIKGDRYASALTFGEIVKLSRVSLPLTALATGLALGLGMPWALVGVAAYHVLYPVATGLIHGHIIHLTREGRAKGPWWVRALADNSFIAWAARNHFIHHASLNHSNFNVCFPGADIVFGTYAKPSFLDLLEMDDENVVYA